MNLPYSQACENNKEPILSVIRGLWTDPAEVLEIGSGTGQHVVHFARHLAHLQWQPSDIAANLPGLQARFDATGLANIKRPLVLDINRQPWPLTELQEVFTANTLHIVSRDSVEILYQRLGERLRDHGLFICYGPFNKHGHYTSDSNARFDAWLREQDPVSGIRDIDDLASLAAGHGLQLADEVDMPANNKILVFKKSVRTGISP